MIWIIYCKEIFKFIKIQEVEKVLIASKWIMKQSKFLSCFWNAMSHTCDAMTLTNQWFECNMLVNHPRNLINILLICRLPKWRQTEIFQECFLVQLKVKSVTRIKEYSWINLWFSDLHCNQYYLTYNVVLSIQLCWGDSAARL